MKKRKEKCLNLTFLVTVYVAIPSFTRFVLMIFRDFLTRNPIPNCLFPFLSRNVQLKGFFLFSSTEFVFDSWIPQMTLLFLRFHCLFLLSSLPHEHISSQLQPTFQNFFNISGGPLPNHHWPGRGAMGSPWISRGPNPMSWPSLN